jgi:hypothetical protein
VVVTQRFHDSGGGFGADTAAAARDLAARFAWTEESYRRFTARLREALPVVYEAEAGFFPPPWPESAPAVAPKPPGVAALAGA